MDIQINYLAKKIRLLRSDKTFSGTNEILKQFKS